MKKMITTGLAFLMIYTLLIGCQDDSSGDDIGANDSSTVDLDNYTQDALTDDEKYALAYMWHEEKLAYDIYIELDKVNPANQLNSIATKSEINHITLVEDLIEWYDINVTNIPDYTINYSKEELDAMPIGVFAIDKIQKLYDDLYAIGAVSTQKSLEVGCMVEVVDVDDLLEFIEDAHGNEAILDTFTILLEGSYKHYWAFDNGLKKMNISDGCCSLGIEFCKPDYPNN